MSARTAQLNQPVPSKVVRDINPLDTSTPMQDSTQARLATNDETEQQTTPEASLTYIDLEPEDENQQEATRQSQSTLNGATFHTTHRTSKLGDGDESQSWQIHQTQRGTGHTEH